MNKAMLIGNIANDLELRQTQTGKSMLNFTVAVNEGYGEKKTTDFIDVRAWEVLAENIAKYCRKGSKIYVEGKNKTDLYEKDGQKMKQKYILANTVEFLESKQDSKPMVRVAEPKRDLHTNTQQTLSGDGRDATGFRIEPEDLPFY